MITVYSKPNCAQCTMTKKVLDDNGISYTLIDVYENTEAKDHVKSLGFQSMPVVEADGHEPWFGFRPDRLEKLAGDKK